MTGSPYHSVPDGVAFALVWPFYPVLGALLTPLFAAVAFLSPVVSAFWARYAIGTAGGQPLVCRRLSEF
jgi:hypothetical protein